MKKINALILFFLISFSMFSESFFSEFIGISDLDGPVWANVCAIYENNNDFFLYRIVLNNIIDGYSLFYEDLNAHNKNIDDFGFPYYDIPLKRMCILNGGRRFIYIDSNYNPTSNPYNFAEYYNAGGTPARYRSTKGSWTNQHEVTAVWSKEFTKQMLYECKPAFHKVSNGVILSCSSNLRDSINYYSIKNIESNFISDYKNINYVWDSTLVPWAEAEEGSGIGVTIDIEFTPNEYSDITSYEKGMCNAFVIMNGYVDFFRRDLFKKNNRVKTLQVESTDGLTPFSFIVDLEDTPDFQQVNLPRYAKSIRITIKDVYNGTLYDDTCLSGIFTVGKNYCDTAPMRNYIKYNFDPFAVYFFNSFIHFEEWKTWEDSLFNNHGELHH